MTIHLYTVKNADGKIVRVLNTGTKSMKLALDKLEALHGENSCFFKLEYAGTKQV